MLRVVATAVGSDDSLAGLTRIRVVWFEGRANPVLLRYTLDRDSPESRATMSARPRGLHRSAASGNSSRLTMPAGRT